GGGPGGESAGVVGGKGRPQAASPARVSQIHGPPGPNRADWAYPARRHDPVMARARDSPTPSTAATWSSCAPYMSATNSSPVMSRPAMCAGAAAAGVGGAGTTCQLHHGAATRRHDWGRPWYVGQNTNRRASGTCHGT